MAVRTRLDVTSRAPFKLDKGTVLLRVIGRNFRPSRILSGVRVSTPADVPTTYRCNAEREHRDSAFSLNVLTCVAVFAGTVGHVGGACILLFD